MISSPSSKSVCQQYEQKRMPCRGCLASCEYIDKCDGKPWRMVPQKQVEPPKLVQ